MVELNGEVYLLHRCFPLVCCCAAINSRHLSGLFFHHGNPNLYILFAYVHLNTALRSDARHPRQNCVILIDDRLVLLQHDFDHCLSRHHNFLSSTALHLATSAMMA